MLLNIKFIIVLVIIFVIVALASIFYFIANINEKEFLTVKDNNYRIVNFLTKDLFSDADIWNKEEGIAEIIKRKDRFIQTYNEITGENIFLLNLYNKDSFLISSTFNELEEIKAIDLNNNKVEDVLFSGENIIIYERLKESYINSYLQNIDLNTKVLEIFVPIKINGKIYGVAEAYFVPTIKSTQYIIYMAITSGIGILVALLLMYLLFYKYIILPINIIRAATYPVSRGEFSRFINIKQNDAIGGLAEDFNRMIRGLNSFSGEINRLKEIGKMKSEFISIVAHQLRTPLAGIKWVLETIFEKDLDNGVKQWLLKVQELNERMIEIITDFLNAARIEEGRLGYEIKENVNLIELLNKVIDSHTISIGKKNINFSFLNNSSDVFIKADESKLKIVFTNLLENAIDYTREGGSVKMDLQKEKDFVNIKISDNGIGISKEDISKLFTRFFRAKEARTIKTAGSGIGLFVAKNIVKKHNGDIFVESELGKGTTFIVKLPIYNKL